MEYNNSIKKFSLLMEDLHEFDIGEDVEFKIGNVYNTYYATYILQMGLADDSLDELLFVVDELKDYYLQKYKTIIVLQLYKYWKRSRISAKFEKMVEKYERVSDLLEEEFGTLVELMKNTFRSDMSRLNKNWIELAQHLKELEVLKPDRARSPKFKESVENILLKLDRINNTVHNTGEQMLSKFSNGDELLKALDKASRAEPEEIKRKVTDRFLRRL